MTSSTDNTGQTPEDGGDSLVIAFPDESSHPRDMLLWAGVLVLLTLVAYWPSTDGKFLWNDDANVSKNPLMKAPGGLSAIWSLRWSDPKHYPLAQYHPFTSTIYWLQYQLFGNDASGMVAPFGFHVTNLVLGAGAVVLAWLILHKLKVPGAWVIAALFALHPLNTESVAWISQLSSVLAGLLFFGAIYCFLLFVEEEEKAVGGAAVDPARVWGFYAASVLLFILGMLSKSTAFAMPLVMLLILWWQRKLSRRLTTLLLPMVLIGVIMAFMAADFERDSAGLAGIDLSLGQRLIIAGRAVWFYAGKLLLPIHLTILYPKWSPDAGDLVQYLPLVGAIVVIIAAWLLQRRLGRGLAVAITAFVLCLLPALGFFNQRAMQFMYVADHYAYLAILPLIALLVGAVTQGIRKIKSTEARTKTAVGVAVVVLLASGALSWSRSQVFAGDLDLWQDTVAKNPDSWFARDRYATAIGAAGEAARAAGDADTYTKNLDLAMEQAKQAAAINPNDAQSQWIIGRILLQQNKKENQDLAVQHLERATALDDQQFDAWEDLANVLKAQGKYKEAIVKLDEALRVQPRSSSIHRQLGEVYALLGDNQRALAEQRLALASKPDNYLAQEDYADLLANMGNIKEAKYQYTMILNVQRTRADLWNKVGILYTGENDLKDAAAFFKQAVELDPNFAEAKKNLNLATQMLKQQAATRATTAPATQNSSK